MALGAVCRLEEDVFPDCPVSIHISPNLKTVREISDAFTKAAFEAHTGLGVDLVHFKDVIFHDADYGLDNRLSSDEVFALTERYRQAVCEFFARG